jgi:peptidoglycan biosynthesis protein MviN/MurJ (putative lipid II flippase)
LTTLALASPLLPAMILSNLTGPIIQLQAAQLGEGFVAAYGYASRLHGALSQTLVVGLSTVLLPHLAALWSRGEIPRVVVLFRRLARWTVPVVAYLCIGILLMGETTTKILFQRGAFAAASTEQVGWLWLLLSLSLFQSAFGAFVAKLCQALRGTGAVLASNVILFSVTWIVAHVGVFAASIDIVVCASAAAYLATLFFWLIWLNRRLDGKPVLQDIASALLRTAVILAPAGLAERYVQVITADLPDLPALIIRASTFSAIALLILVATRSHLWFTDRRPDLPSQAKRANLRPGPSGQQ